MADRPTLPRALVRRAENVELSLGSLEAISEIRTYLNALEKLSIASAREKGATVEDIAEALKLTPQAIYYRFRNEKLNVQTTPGQPNVPDTAAAPEPTLEPEPPTLGPGPGLPLGDPKNPLHDPVNDPGEGLDRAARD